MARLGMSLLHISAAAFLATSLTRLVSAYDERDFFPPALGNGNMLIDTRTGYGEPLNIIISGKSSPEVLTDLGLVNWARSIGMSYECLNMHGKGGWYSADLGDGHGYVRQQTEMRQMYSDAQIGSCLETFVGGNHFRSFKQNGPKARTNAVFLSASHEEDMSTHHSISPNGYDMGRDEIVARAINDTTSFGGVTFNATVEDVHGLLDVGVEFINHNIAIDGIVKLLTIQIIGTDEKAEEWLDIIMAEEGLTTTPGHRESRLLFTLPDPDKAPNEDAKPESGPEVIMMDEYESELGSTRTSEESTSTTTTTTTTTTTITSTITTTSMSTSTSSSSTTSTSTTTSTSAKPTYKKQGSAKLVGFSSSR